MSFFSRHPDEIVAGTTFEITPDEITLVNPNTMTCPTFLTRADADTIVGIYRRLPVLVRDVDGGQNPWGLSFGTLFHMANDSGLFRQAEVLTAAEFDGWSYRHGGEDYLPLYEAKLLWLFDHRFSSYALRAPGSRDTELPRLDDQMHDDPLEESLAQHWVSRPAVEKALAGRWDRGWMLGWRDITGTSNMRTFAPSVFPTSAVGHVFPLAFPANATHAPLLHAAWSSLVCDYIARQKLSGTHMTYNIVRQLACPAPDTFAEPTAWQPDRSLAEWISPYVLELSYTSWRLQPYSQDMGDHGPPFRWNPERRAMLRADLDAAFLHVYGLMRSEAEHVLDSFPGVRKHDVRDHGEYRTRRLVLDAYDRMAAAMAGGAAWAPLAPVPAGKGLRHPARP